MTIRSMLSGVFFLTMSLLSSCGSTEIEEPSSDSEIGYEAASWGNCSARCSNNPPAWTRWYNRGREPNWADCKESAKKFCRDNDYRAWDATFQAL